MIKLYTEWADPGKTGVIQPGNSWLKGMALIYSAISGRNGEDDGTEQIRDTSNSLFTFEVLNGTARGLDVTAAASDVTHGILVGTGTTAVTKIDHAMETLIADGSGGSQLEYGTMVISAATGISGGYRVTLSRQFDNGSGGDITVKECGVAVTCKDSSLNVVYVLIIHDLQTQLISDGTSKVFKYHLDFLV